MPRADTAGAADAARDLPMLDAAVADCFACPRLVAWREEQARVKVARFRDESYWGRPVPGFGPGDARILLVASRPPRMAAIARDACSRATRPATSCGGRCSPSDWRTGPSVAAPTMASRSTASASPQRSVRAARQQAHARGAATCRPYLVREIALLTELKVIVALGAIGWDAALRTLAALGPPHSTRSRASPTAPKRGSAVRAVGTYHPSQQNTFTGRLTPPMLEAVLERARVVAAS